MQAGYHADVRGPVEAVDDLRFVVFGPKADGPVGAPRETPVDAVCEAPDLCREHLVILERGAARGGNLNEGEPADHFRMRFKQVLHGSKTLENPLGVILAVDAQADETVLRQSCGLQNFPPAILHGRLGLLPGRRPLN